MQMWNMGCGKTTVKCLRNSSEMTTHLFVYLYSFRDIWRCCGLFAEFSRWVSFMLEAFFCRLSGSARSNVSLSSCVRSDAIRQKPATIAVGRNSHELARSCGDRMTMSFREHVLRGDAPRKLNCVDDEINHYQHWPHRGLYALSIKRALACY